MPTTRRVVALTFDCGSNAAGIPAILSALGAADAPATFFMTGDWVTRYRQQAQAIAARYPLGNHTQDHPHLPALSDSAVRAQISSAEAAIRALGAEPRPLFRFPYGDSDARTLRLVNAAGYGSIRWTVDTLGWKGSAAGQSVATVLTRVENALRPGAIVLMHVGSAPDGSTLDADALPEMIRRLRALDYSLVTVSEFTRL